MSNTEDNNWFYDIDGNKLEVIRRGASIQLYGWTITEDSCGRPYETHADTLNLTPRQAIEVARRLFIAATE